MTENSADLSSKQTIEGPETPKSAKFISVMLPKSVLINKNDSNTSIDDLVLTDTTKALSLLKQVKGSRLRMFDNYEDALNCSIEGISDQEFFSEPPKEKVAANFPSVTTPELSRLRRAIEQGDYNLVHSLICLNPKFLITSSDTPVILMEGPRYNAVHIASKFNQLDILDYILKTVNNPNFIKQLYPNDSDAITEETRKHLLDLYLNTPDKAALDTPLHFASKFAAVDCVKLLLSYSFCDRERRNKFNETAYDVICTRKNDVQAARKIKEYFEARYYVAIDRKLDRVTVCKPCETPPNDDSISGIAGPMSPKLAKKMYNTLKSPAKSTSPRKFCIRFTDASRGVERVARMECRRYNLNWVEYWPFLNCYIDLASPEGLTLFENHLRKVHDDLTSKPPDDEESPGSVNLINDSKHERSTISLLCDELECLTLASNQNIKLHDVSGDFEPIKSGGPDDSYDDNEHKSDPESSEDESHESYATPPSSPIMQLDFYINGKQFSQGDKDAANALMDTIIDQDRYPYIAQWLKKVKIKQSIPSPFKEPRENFPRSIFSAHYASTPRKSINLIDLITPRRFSFDQPELHGLSDDDDNDDDDVFEDSICQFGDENSDEESIPPDESNKENFTSVDKIKSKFSSRA